MQQDVCSGPLAERSCGCVQGEQKKALRRLIERYELPVTLTAQQNLILQDVEPAWKADVQDTLAAAGLVYGPLCCFQLPFQSWHHALVLGLANKRA